MLTSRAWPQGTDPNFSGQQYRQTFTRKMAASQKAYIYEHNVPEGRGRDNETQVRDQMQVIDIRVIRRVRQEETEVRKLKNTFSASL